MYKIKKTTLIFFILLIAFSQVAFHLLEERAEQRLKIAIYQQAAQDIFDKIEEQIEEKQQSTLMLNVGISSYISRVLADSHEQNKKSLDQIFTTIDEILRQLTENTRYKNIWFQLTDLSGHSLYRSWTPDKDSLLGVRPEIKVLIRSPELKTSVSAGRFDVSIKAIVPITIMVSQLFFSKP